MNIGEALGIAEKSIPSFKEKMEKIRLKELYELTENLRFANTPPAFETAFDVLKKRLNTFYSWAKEGESKSGDTILRIEAYRITGFEIFNAQSPEFDHTVLPSAFFQSLISTVSQWK